ncbi:MAG: NADH pyrophosphatase [Microbacterium sp. SCN 70-200]|uniref:NAD(+) diphosphatase n=1 Tax=unclassified Microbacterium TaxID=2609290 RepID=UPI00086EC504|nr:MULTISPECIES: NAD(+) diphosphatase [unclassified Microbacterium]MBN9213232.1 NAD(+) diphosphatase [Microbacterium sp.]ODT40699.1 MAG: NADH pyrophosphatase [Microbacterium sp. SCN 70-200]OJV83696.1 MAG: NADH pyrophosphatase [Microbacterium sp. 70-16]
MTRSDAPQPPALARAGIDRSAEEREQPDLVDSLRADPATRVVAVHGDRGLVSTSGPHLHTVGVADVSGDVEWAFLGRDDAGFAMLLAVSGPDAEPPVVVPDGAEWAALRAVGGELDPVAAALLVEAVSLGRWLVDAPFCPACGARTRTRAAGWARHCPSCGREHFPRTDPAVIVAVQSADGERLLLGKNALWAGRNMYSTFAGFVEAGESLESAITREIHEESGVVVAASSYRGSQAWPYPRSLMLGFHATCTPDSVVRADGVEIVDARWFDRAELAEALAGRSTDGVALPGTASIAYRLIVDWVESAP